MLSWKANALQSLGPTLIKLTNLWFANDPEDIRCIRLEAVQRRMISVWHQIPREQFESIKEPSALLLLSRYLPLRSYTERFEQRRFKSYTPID